MATFGEFFDRTDRRLQSTGRTDSACRWVGDFRDRYRSDWEYYLGDEDPGWKSYRDKELSKENFCEFVAFMMSRAGDHLNCRSAEMNNRPDFLTWSVNGVYLTYQTIIDEANRCGLKIDPSDGLSVVKDEIKTIAALTR